MQPSCLCCFRSSIVCPAWGTPTPSFPHPPPPPSVSPGKAGRGVRAHLRDALARCRELQGRDQLCDVLPSQLIPTLVAMQMGKDAVARYDRSLGGKARTVTTVSCTPASDCTEPVTPSSYSYCKRCRQTSNESVRWLLPWGPKPLCLEAAAAAQHSAGMSEHSVVCARLPSRGLCVHCFTEELQLHREFTDEEKEAWGDGVPGQGRDRQGAQQRGTTLQSPDVAAAQRPMWEQSG